MTAKVQLAAKGVGKKNKKQTTTKAPAKKAPKKEEEDDDDFEDVDEVDDLDDAPPSENEDSYASKLKDKAIEVIGEMIQFRAVGVFLFAAVAIYRYGDNMSV